MKGDFIIGNIGEDGIKIDDFLKNKGIERVEILHSDIQGAEFEMLLGAEKSIKDGKIKYIFISSHSQKLHYTCMGFLKSRGYTIIASADYKKQTYSFDGVLVARLTNLKGLEPIKIELADWGTDSIITELIYNLPDRIRCKLCILYYDVVQFMGIYFVAKKFRKFAKFAREHILLKRI